MLGDSSDHSLPLGTSPWLPRHRRDLQRLTFQNKPPQPAPQLTLVG